jgi:hypothetical protein
MKRIVLINLLVIFCFDIVGQIYTERKAKLKFPVMVAFTAHSYSWPISRSFVTPIQPGFVIGSEYRYSADKKAGFLQTFNLGYFKNPDFLKAYYLNSYFTFRYIFRPGIFAETGIGAGYFHKRYARESFVLNENGQYESKTDWGSPGVQGGVKISAGYIFKLRESRLSAFLTYECFVEYPHAKGSIPFLTHSLYHIGIRYQLNS